MRAIVWFRRDLRISDNTALSEAAAKATRGVVGAYLLSPGQWCEHHEAACKIDFWLGNLRALSDELGKLNIPLLIETADSFDDAPAALVKLVQRCEAQAVYCDREYEVNEARRDDAAERALIKAGVEVHRFHDRLIIPPGVVRTNDDTIYKVFTPFRKAWVERLAESDGVKLRSTPRKQDALPRTLASSSVPAMIEGFESKLDASLYPPGEKHALRLLKKFIDKRIADYHSARDLPAVEGTSRLSPYLAAGVISARQCLAAAREANNGRVGSGRKGIVTWISELIWREFYTNILAGFPRVSMGRPFDLATEKITWLDNDDHFAAWCDGRTGYPIVDAAMRQLAQTGWMHNRLRMIAAMFLSKHLLLDWRRGERHFMRNLIDGDLANNNGGWQWSASTGTDAAPYFRVFNPTAQSRKCDPQGEFVRSYCPELAGLEDREIHDPSPSARESCDYLQPIVEHAAARKRAIEAFKSLR